MKSALSKSSTLLRQCMGAKSVRVLSSVASEPLYKHQSNMSIDDLFKIDSFDGKDSIVCLSPSLPPSISRFARFLGILSSSPLLPLPLIAPSP